jgi:uncharacterized protein YbjT (DUF2867 family)
MKIAVIGGTGLIGSQVVRILNAGGHEAVPHSPSSGLDLISGDGLAEAMNGVDVVVNLSNSPTFDEASPAFFQTSMDNMLAAARDAGVGHAVVLSIVGVDQVPDLSTTARRRCRRTSSRPVRCLTRSCGPRSSTSSWTR